RYADNARGLLSIADACGGPWPERARAAVMLMHEKDMAERPQVKILRHGLVLFDALGLAPILSIPFNTEIKRLARPDANWHRYRGRSGTDYAHSLELFEQARLLKKVGVESRQGRGPDGKNRHGYTRAQFEEALRKHAPSDAEPERGPPPLRLITPTPD